MAIDVDGGSTEKELGNNVEVDFAQVLSVGSIFDTTHIRPSTSKSRSPRIQGGFIKGPIPLRWIQQAAKLPGKALHLGNALWYLVGLQKKRTVKVTKKTRDLFGLSRQSSNRAAYYLEKAGLVRIERKTGKGHVYTIIDGTYAANE